MRISGIKYTVALLDFTTGRAFNAVEMNATFYSFGVFQSYQI